MASYLLHEGALVTCEHAGQAKPVVTNPRVKVSGNAVVTQPAGHSITGCTLPPSAGGPCATARWVTAAVRVRAGGEPVLLSDSEALCLPTFTGVKVLATQVRVEGR